MNHTPERPKDTTTGEVALTTVANPRRTRVGADGPAPVSATKSSQR